MRVAAVDLGTNTLRLLIADVIDGAVIDVARNVDVVGLGLGVDETGLIADASLERASDVLAGYGLLIAEAGANRVRAVATSAARDASNRAELVDRVERAIGHSLEIITGAEEAHLAFGGAVLDEGRIETSLVIDPGGGSTEFVLGTDSPEYVISVDIGSVRLTDRLLARRPAPPEEVDAARRHVASLFESVDLPRPAHTVIGVAGTFTSLAAIHLDLPVYDRNAVHRTRLSAAEFEDLVERLSRLTEAETAAIPSMDPKRAPVILSGAVIVAEAVALVGAAEVVVSESDSLDGIALQLSRG